MILKKYRWSRAYESAEEELVGLLKIRNIDALRWTAEEFEDFNGQITTEDQRIWCADGSLSLMINGKKFTLQAGDTLDLPAHTHYDAQSGMAGCVCYQIAVKPSEVPSEFGAE